MSSCTSNSRFKPNPDSAEKLDRGSKEADCGICITAAFLAGEGNQVALIASSVNAGAVAIISYLRIQFQKFRTWVLKRRHSAQRPFENLNF